jgi:hypothetical protein
MASDVSISQSLRRFLDTLSRPISSISDLHSTLSSILHDLASAHNADLDKIGKLIYLIQKEIVDKVLPVWKPVLKVDGEEMRMVKTLFVPSTVKGNIDTGTRNSKDFRFAEDIAVTIALSTFQTISTSFTPKLKAEETIYLLDLLQDLLDLYPFDRIYTFLYLQQNGSNDRNSSNVDLIFQTYTQTLLGLSGKVGNVLGRLRVDGITGKQDDGRGWDERGFWNGVCRGIEHVLWKMSSLGGKSSYSRSCSPKGYEWD